MKFLTKKGSDIAANEPQEANCGPKKRTVRNKFLSVTAALPLDDIGIF